MALKKPFSRRQLIKCAGASAAGLVLADSAGFIRPASAAAPMKDTQVPGWYRFKLGTFEITILSDGSYELPNSLMATNRSRDEVDSYLGANFLPIATRTSYVNIPLINTGSELILVDVGGGPNWQPTAGRLVDNMKAAGYQPEDVDKVVLTHGHPDHIWGLIDEFDDAPRFPNATYYISEREWSFWITDEAEQRLPEAFKGFAIGAKKHLQPLADTTKRIKPGIEIVPGLVTFATSGHTPGHMSLIVTSEGQSLIVTSDSVTHPYTSFEHPGWWPGTDLEPDVAEETRRRLLDLAATDKAMLLVYHISFPGLGHVARAGDAYRWVPASWKWQL